MGKGEHKAEWFARINPNGRIPAIMHVKDDGTSVTVFESAACLLYMASEFDKEHKLSYPNGTQEYWNELSWVSSSWDPYCQSLTIDSYSFRGRLRARAL